MSLISSRRVRTMTFGRIALMLLGAWTVLGESTEKNVEYGVDVSFPMHHKPVSTNYDWLPHNRDPSVSVPRQYKDMVVQPLGDKDAFYQKYMQGCRDKLGRKANLCDSGENARLVMNLRQPSSMQNYTETGFAKIKAPEKVFRLIKDFWEKNKHKQTIELWGNANIFANHWEIESSFVSVEDSTLRGGGTVLKNRIWDAARETLEEWTGQSLTPCSLYGIRVYHDGAVLSPHVDRLPLVSSAIINVDQDVDEPWPLEVIGHDGKAHNVTMEPGDMVLYESHSILHGRPFPLKGRYYANIFIHFEPIGHSLRHGVSDTIEDVDKQYKRSAQEKRGGHENDYDGKLPVYILPGSAEDASWRARHPDGWKPASIVDFSTGSTPAHKAAMLGDVESLRDIAQTNRDELHAKDKNGWQPLHEASRAGHKEALALLIEFGANINERTNHGIGGTPLYLAKSKHGSNHPIIDYILSIGGLDIGPEL